MSKLVKDIKFTAELILELISEFNINNHPENLNFFIEDEQLECLSASELASNLSNHFDLDVERLRQVLNKDLLTQQELIVLSHHAISLANKCPSDSKRKNEETGEKSKKQKVTGPSVSFLLFKILV